MTDILNYYTDKEKEILSDCTLCPRKCHKNRLNGEKGFCNLDVDLNIALICLHKGEEPVISGKKGICNIFFSHCNCQCVFCQNHKISNNCNEAKNLYSSVKEAVDKIIEILKESENIVGFVSPTHQVPAMNVIIRELHKRGVFPKFVYNSNGYDNVEILKELEGVIDVYVPDFKYVSEDIAQKFSKTKDYGEKTLLAIKEMYRQKGSTLITDNEEKIESGLIIRHLLLPHHLEESKKVLDTIAWDISTSVSLSIMSQYTPPFTMPYAELNCKTSEEEYNELADFFYSTGFHNGWLQDLSSNDSCLPDFDNNRFLNQE
ncbi:MAG: 4Fe-4S cluster-binding domain-containing protein [Bacteroidales bacterium]|nr:4Fe-4S cluster-binding domain-containing protein [Bacteroidales bacterium]